MFLPIVSGAVSKWTMRATLALGVLLVHTLAGCGKPTGLHGVQIWATPDWTTVFPDAPAELENEVFSHEARLIRLEAGVNEIVSFQLVFASKEPASIWGVAVSDLRQGDKVIPSKQVELYRERCVPVDDYPAWYLRLTPYLRRHREYPDVLVPLNAARGALPIELEPGRAAAVWVDIHVPLGADPGPYRGVVRVVPQNGTAGELDLLVNVEPFAIPQTRHLTMIAGLETRTLLRHHLEVAGRPYVPPRLNPDDPAYGRAAAMIKDTVGLLHRHRCNPVLTDVYPLRRFGDRGQVVLDWVDYDRLVGVIIDGSGFEDRTPASAWPMPVGENEPSPAGLGGWASPGYESALADHLRQCAEHFQERGWLDRHFVWLPVPARTRAEGFREFERLGHLVRQADARLKLVCPLTPQPMEPYGWLDEGFRDLSSFVSTWCPPASLADPEALSRQQAAGRQVWLRPDRPPYCGSLALIAPPVHAQSIPWQAYRFGHAGVMLEIVNRWSADGKPSDLNSQQALLWPGTPFGLDRPIPSIRLKRLLRGAQDHEYLWLLEHNRRPGIARRVAADLVRAGGTEVYGDHFLDGGPNGFVADPSAWSLARRLMARELTAAMRERGAEADAGVREDVAKFEQQMEWTRLLKIVRQVHTRAEGTRVQIDLNNPTHPVHVETTVSVFNGTSRAFSGALSCAALPEGWQAGEPPPPIERLEPSRGTRRVIRAKAPSVNADIDGVFDTTLRLTEVDGESRDIPARLCALTAHRLTLPMVIDGKLNDWPLGSTNVAGDFVLVGAVDVPKVHRPTPDRPSQSTTAYVCNDAGYLYLAFNCEDDRLDERAVWRTNYVSYDDLWPTGEDLVEVVLDPTGKAVGPGDLLHLVVKANGAVVTERGVGCLEPVCRRADWPADARVAIDDRSRPDRWTVEIRIPLSSLGRPAPVLGVNFARYHARRGEYASWSAAPRYLYSPMSLGNMRLQP